MNPIERPSFVVSRKRALENIRAMAEKARLSGVPLRPHFKTHQSLEIGGWYRDAGIDRITVSSVSMAEYFADGGWDDITIAFPVNILEAGRIDALAGRVRLGVLVDNVTVVRELERRVRNPLGIWIKIDTGYRRAGIDWENRDATGEVYGLVAASARHRFAGLLTHAGHSYGVRGREEHARLFEETARRMRSARSALPSSPAASCPISVGDTPTCSAVERFDGADEVRAGNFVFFDVQQLRIGSCAEEQIAAAVVCPVVAVYPERGEAIIYGGGIHLSKQAELLDGGAPFYGFAVSWDGKGWGKVRRDHYLKSLSQEHGIVHYGSDIPVRPGDLLAVLPVHSCLAMNLLRDEVVITE